jgi:hypothetical protein
MGSDLLTNYVVGLNTDLFAKMKLITTHLISSLVFLIVFPSFVANQSVVYQHLKDLRRLP